MFIYTTGEWKDVLSLVFCVSFFLTWFLLLVSQGVSPGMAEDALYNGGEATLWQALHLETEWLPHAFRLRELMSQVHGLLGARGPDKLRRPASLRR